MESEKKERRLIGEASSTVWYRPTSAGNERCWDANTSGIMCKLESPLKFKVKLEIWTFLDVLWRWILLEDEGRRWKTESSKCSDIFVKKEFVFRPETRRSAATGHLEAGRPITVHHRVSRCDRNTSGVSQETVSVQSFSFEGGWLL